MNSGSLFPALLAAASLSAGFGQGTGSGQAAAVSQASAVAQGGAGAQGGTGAQGNAAGQSSTGQVNGQGNGNGEGGAVGDDAGQHTGVPEKWIRTTAQRKIDSQLLEAIYGDVVHAAAQIDHTRRALVDVRTKVTPATRALVRRYSVRLVSASELHDSIVAWVPLDRLELLAADRRVTAIVPAARGLTNRKDVPE
jgi:hypothetical protein